MSFNADEIAHGDSHPDGAGSPGEWPIAPDSAEPSELVEVPADIPRGPPPRRREWVRLGPVAVPVSVAAWGLSLACHAALVVAAVYAVRFVAPASSPTVQFALGDGGVGGGIYRGPDAPGFTDFGLGNIANEAGDAGGATNATPLRPAAPVPDEPLAPASPEDQTSVSPRIIEEATRPTYLGVGPAELTVPNARHQPPGLMRAGGPNHGGGAAESAALAASAGRGGNGSGTAAGREGIAGGGTSDAAGAGRGGGGGGTPGVPAGAAGGRLPAPSYPRESRRRGEQGRVVLEVEVRPDGSIGEVRVLADSGFPRLTAAAIEAVRAARFTPARQEGQPVASWVRIPFDFSLR